ncbi:hypothetical protein M23134_06912 [Microscilla marina ATCC 23134]|uniref:Uncharacterized protein n=2 Tax=Microscilla marina TaxID=1027 RepID=A1ZQA2_MICM2|nr:hypothetical protein M23134_06912 [Microscilla marina ATCC 23134]
MFAGFLMFACLIALGGYAAMSGNKKTFKATSATNLNQKITVTDSVQKAN